MAKILFHLHLSFHRLSHRDSYNLSFTWPWPTSSLLYLSLEGFIKQWPSDDVYKPQRLWLVGKQGIPNAKTKIPRHILRKWPGARFSKVPRTFRARKAIRKITTAYSVKLVFSYVVKGIKIKINAKFRASRRLRFEDTKRIMSPEIRPKSFGTFDKRAQGLKLTAWRVQISATKCLLS